MTVRHISSWVLIALVALFRSDGGATVSAGPADGTKADQAVAEAESQVLPDDLEGGPKVNQVKPPALAVHGLVIDATTKRGIPRFRVIPASQRHSAVTWQPHYITTHRGGRFDLPPDVRAWDETRFRVEAEGYRPSISRVVKKSEGDVKLTFAMQADAGISAVVRTPDGAPAAGARATWVTHSREATIRRATITLMDHGERLGATVITADAAGRLRLPPECDPGTIVVVHDRGYAEIRPAELLASGVVTLRRWGRVEGLLLAGTKAVARHTIWLQRPSASADPPTASWYDEVNTDTNGRFVCEGLVAGRLAFDRVFPTNDGQCAVSGLTTTIEVREGQTTRVTFGGPGRTLVGRFEAPKDLRLPIDWTKAHVNFGPKAPHIGFPGDDAIWKVYQAFLNTEEGRAYHGSNLPVGRDGSFRIESVPPGEYQLMITIDGPAVGKPAETRIDYAAGGAQIEVNPTVDSRGEEPQSFGTITLQKIAGEK
jgi:hypothetical protein